ncbi:activator of Hsp90 ATPase 1 family protein [Akanthomyces lecanii RCEF 1005]|uniref:Activator of Hsp90 ATPase 1 family protein n=1 Tax=Akanthomyces lecanii RCEF 1005 TaxID=1081108 RepID=A0A168G0T2_CORDF|nr:activator of Hsp90 ATPase 1 family protein [Akanthomyces lecanii RCEF 1005]
MTTVTTSKLIAASPEIVRSVMLDFPRLPEWTQGFIRSIKPAKDGSVSKGDKLNVTLEGASFSPTILENSAQEFKWRGSIPGLFYGDHVFRFEPGPRPDTTLFTQSEEFSGILAFIIKFIPLGSKQRDGFEDFNEDLRRRVEGEASTAAAR